MMRRSLSILLATVFLLTSVSLVSQPVEAQEKKEVPSVEPPLLSPNTPRPFDALNATIEQRAGLTAEEILSGHKRFAFKIDPKTPISDLLPAAQSARSQPAVVAK